jgi:hypothetical protein
MTSVNCQMSNLQNPLRSNKYLFCNNFSLVKLVTLVTIGQRHLVPIYYMKLEKCFDLIFFFLEKVFSYLSSDELEKLKAEEERKIANLSAADINMLDHSDSESFDSQSVR